MNGVSSKYTVLLIPSLAEMIEVLAILSCLPVIEPSCKNQLYFHGNQECGNAAINEYHKVGI